MNLSGKQVLVLGLGDTGLSMARHLVRQGARVRVADTRVNPPMAGRLTELLPGTLLHTGPFRAESFQKVDLIAISPGIDKREPLIAKAAANGVPLVGDVELFAQAMNAKPKEKRPIVIGITGSNGKTTVTTLVGEMCRSAGLKVVVAGNIGLPVLEAFAEAEQSGQPDVYILELSSFQLETTSSLSLNAATVLNVSEDHMDRYVNVTGYATAKARIFRHAAIQVINRDDARVLAMADRRKTIYSFGLRASSSDREWGVIRSGRDSFLAHGQTQLMPVTDLTITGAHNTANALAALALVRAIDLPYPPTLEALRTFKGLPHRVEKVMEINGVTYYDDSKATNVGATSAALSGMGAPIVLIAGGEGKGQDFSPLKDAIGKHAKAVILIGRDAPLLESAICSSQVPIELSPSLRDAVHRAAAIAQPGDVVLLSPACASFDMFRNYIHRAEVFIDAVMELQRAHGEQHVL